MRFDRRQIQSALVRVLRERGEEELQEADALEIAFHMTDWLGDLEAWLRFCERPEKASADDVERMLSQFLVHVPAHLLAATRLYLGRTPEDIFRADNEPPRDG